MKNIPKGKSQGEAENKAAKRSSKSGEKVTRPPRQSSDEIRKISSHHPTHN